MPPALRWLAGLVVFCLLLQSLLLPAQRTAARTHVHIGAVWAQAWAEAWPGIARSPAAEARQQGQVEVAPRSLFMHAGARAHDQGAAHAHAHAHAAKHDHDGHDGDDAVALNGVDAEDPASAAAVLKRHLFDHDAVSSQLPACLTAVPAPVIASETSRHHRSHIEPPLERPPRARG